MADVVVDVVEPTVAGAVGHGQPAGTDHDEGGVGTVERIVHGVGETLPGTDGDDVLEDAARAEAGVEGVAQTARPRRRVVAPVAQEDSHLAHSPNGGHGVAEG